MATLAARMAGAMKADVRIFEEIEKDPGALGQAVAVIVISGFAVLIGNIFRHGLAGGFGYLLAALIGYVVWAGLVVVIGTKLMPEPSTRADFPEAFRVLGFAASPGVFHVLAIIPFIGPLISTCVHLWTLVVMVVAVRSVLDYTSTARAFVVCLIGFVIYLILYLMVLLPLLTARAILG
jgi:Yip1 domain